MLAMLIFLSAIMAGIIQSVTGFGSGIILMLFFPAFFPVLNASALSSSICLAASAKVSLRYRRQIQWKMTILPSILYMATSALSLSLAKCVPNELFGKIFGAFLVALSLYFLLINQNIKMKASVPLAVLCAGLSGVSGALFGISGPPMVIYFLAALDDKEQYLGTLQVVFTVNAIYLLIVRIYAGIYTSNLVIYSLIGLLGVLVGELCGHKIADRINKEKMKKIIYLFLGLSGIINIFK